MLKILMVTPDPDSLATLSAALTAEAEVMVAWDRSGEQGLKTAAGENFNLVVVDEQIKDMSPHRFLSRLLEIDAMVNTAVVSNQPAEVFHEVYEGLGVLAQLPPQPGKADADMLLIKLGNLTDLVP